jgi:murein DD-endopeptidase MepM/ murein hydrolase activator NlpD
MTDATEYPTGLFTPAETPRLPASAVTTTPFTGALYPTQLEPLATVGLAGEQRGFYGGNRWRPSWSAYGHPRGTKRHGGVDIYAPRGTPIVAMVDGEVTQRPESDGNGMGNRVHLAFVAFGVAYKFIIGHLESFAGGAASVRKGTVIGYSGCTGNADNGQPCSTANNCGKYSTHIHLQLHRVADNRVLDPLLALGWALKYQDDARDVLCSEVVA